MQGWSTLTVAIRSKLLNGRKVHETLIQDFANRQDAKATSIVQLYIKHETRTILNSPHELSPG